VFATPKILCWYALYHAGHLIPSLRPVVHLLTHQKNKRGRCYSTSSTGSGRRLLLWERICNVHLHFSWSLSLKDEDCGSLLLYASKCRTVLQLHTVRVTVRREFIVEQCGVKDTTRSVGARTKNYLRCRQTGRTETDLGQFSQRVQVSFILWEVRSIGIWAADGLRALIDRREGRCTDLEVGKFVVVNFDGIPRVAVPSGHTLPSLNKPSQ